MKGWGMESEMAKGPGVGVGFGLGENFRQCLVYIHVICINV